jgi:glutamate synthase domain-containing protein 2
VKLAAIAGADVVVVDGMQGGTAATQTVFIENVGVPTLAAVRQAVDALEDLKLYGVVQLVVSGGIRTGADVAKALAMGADAVSIGQGMLIALGCNSDSYVQNGEHFSAVEDYAKTFHGSRALPSLSYGQVPGRRDDAGSGPRAAARAAVGARRVRNYLKTMNMELTTIARACGKQNVHHLEREDLVALTVEAAAMANVPLAGTNWIPGQ